MSKVVKLEDVEKLIDLVKHREAYDDWSNTWEKLSCEIDKHIYYIRESSIEID